MKKTNKLYLMLALVLGMFVTIGTANAQSFSLRNFRLYCNPSAIEAGQQSECFLIGMPDGKGDETVHGYFVNSYTTKGLQIVSYKALVPGSNATYTEVTSGTEFIKKPSDGPEGIGKVGCVVDTSHVPGGKVASAGCGVLYTVNSASSAAFTPKSLKNALPENISKEGKMSKNDWGTIGTIVVKLRDDYTDQDCGEVCVNPWRVPTADLYDKYNTCGNDGGIGCGSETANGGKMYVCKEVHQAGKPGEEPNPETGASLSYALLAACALIAISAVVLVKKNNKFNRI